MNDNHKQLNLFNFGKERKVIHKSVIMSLMVNLLPIDEKVAYDFIKEYTESIGK